MKTKLLFIVLITWICAHTVMAQIPRMLQDDWYKELKARTHASDMDEDVADDMTLGNDVVGEMRVAYNAHNWLLVDSLFGVALKEVPDNANIYNWERVSLRRQMKDAENANEMIQKLMNIYDMRAGADLPSDVKYSYGDNQQWNETQRLVDYATYANRRIDVQTQYEFLSDGMKLMERPYNAVVLCKMMDLSLNDNLLTESEFMERCQMLVSEAGSTRTWLNDNFLSMEMQTVSNLLQALDQREAFLEKDPRVKAVNTRARQEEEEKRLRDSESAEERAQYHLLLASRLIADKKFESAVAEIQKSIAIDKDNPIAYLRLSECYTANGNVTGRVGNFLDKYCNQFAAVAAMDMLRENLHYIQSQQGRNAISTQISQLRNFVNQNPIYRQDLFRLSMGYGDVVRLGSYVKRTITIREKY